MTAAVAEKKSKSFLVHRGKMEVCTVLYIPYKPEYRALRTYIRLQPLAL